MIILADQPFVTKQIIYEIVTLYKKEKHNYIASSYNGVLRPPVIFDSNLFSTLFKLHGDEGARKMIRNSQDRINITFKEEKHFLDVDTVKQYQSLKNIVYKAES